MESAIFTKIRSYLNSKGFTDVKLVIRNQRQHGNSTPRLEMWLDDYKTSRMIQRSKKYNADTDLLDITEITNRGAILNIRSYCPVNRDDIQQAINAVYNLFHNELLIERYFGYEEIAINYCSGYYVGNHFTDDQEIKSYAMEVFLNYHYTQTESIEYIKEVPLDIATDPETEEAHVILKYEEV